MAVKLDHDEPESTDIRQLLLKRVHYSEEYVERWMKPRLFYFSKCLMTRTKPATDLYTKDGEMIWPQVRIEDFFIGNRV